MGAPLGIRGIAALGPPPETKVPSNLAPCGVGGGIARPGDPGVAAEASASADIVATSPCGRIGLCAGPEIAGDREFDSPAEMSHPTRIGRAHLRCSGTVTLTARDPSQGGRAWSRRIETGPTLATWVRASVESSGLQHRDARVRIPPGPLS